MACVGHGGGVPLPGGALGLGVHLELSSFPPVVISRQNMDMLLLVGVVACGCIRYGVNLSIMFS